MKNKRFKYWLSLLLTTSMVLQTPAMSLASDYDYEDDDLTWEYEEAEEFDEEAEEFYEESDEFDSEDVIEEDELAPEDDSEDLTEIETVIEDDGFIGEAEVLMEGEPTIVDVTSSLFLDGSYVVVPRMITVYSNEAERFGYSDSVPGEVTMLDVLVKEHELLFGEDFSPETAEDFLSVSESGFVEKCFTEAYEFGFAVNGVTPNDGVLSSPEYGCTGYTIVETVLEDADTVLFYSYQDSNYYMDQWGWFTDETGEPVNEFYAVAGEPISIGCEGYAIAYYGTMPNPSDFAQMIEGATILSVDETGAPDGTIISEPTDEDGFTEIVFDEAGTYYLIMMGDEEYGDPIITPIGVVTVDEARYGLQGSGTQEDPYLISTAENLQFISEQVNSNTNTFNGDYFEFTADITLPEGWEPIGTRVNSSTVYRFGGYIDGNDYLLTIPAGEKCLLGNTAGAKLSNLNIYGTQIASAGVLETYEVGVTLDCDHVTLKSGTQTLRSGFLGGYASGSNQIHITNCVVEEGVVIGYDHNQSNIGSFGGDYNGSITNCSSAATVYGVNFVGGISGNQGQSMTAYDIIGCEFTGTVIASGNYVGGISGGGYGGTQWGIGSAPNTTTAKIEDCSVDASITGADYVGGILGAEPGVVQTWVNNSGRIGSICNNTFTGTVSATDGSYVGAIIGYFNGLNKYNVIEDNVYDCEDSNIEGIGFIKYIDTNYANPIEREGVTYYNTENGKPDNAPGGATRTAHNRTDDPLGADADSLTRSGTSVSKIKVTISVLGDTVHGDGAVHSYHGNNLSQWVGATEYTVDENSKVIDVFAKMAAANGITYTNPKGNYITSITMNGVTLGEFTNGKNSGWMYLLNGEYSDYGVNEQRVKEGDVIVFHYTDDYNLEFMPTFDDFFAQVRDCATVVNDTVYPYEVAIDQDLWVLKSTNQGKNSTAPAIKFTMSKTARLSFLYRVSSEANYDYMLVKKNGTAITDKRNFSGNKTEYSVMTIDTNVGDVIEIAYSKDSSSNSNEDTLYLKDFAAAALATVTFEGAHVGTTIEIQDEEGTEYSAEDNQVSLVDGTYTWTASCFGYEDVSGTFTVEEAQDQTIVIEQVAQAGKTVSFVINGITDEDEVVVTISCGDTVVEELHEEYTASLVPENYSYEVYAYGYKAVTGNFTVETGDVTIPITLEAVATIEGYLSNLLAVAIMDNTGTYPWEVDENGTNIHSTNQGKNSSTSAISFKFTRPVRISLTYKVGSEMNYDKFSIEKTSGNTTSKIVSEASGSVDETTLSTDVGTDDVLKFYYSKDSSGDRNGDTASVSNIQIAPLYQVILNNAPDGAVITLKNSEDEQVRITNGVAVVEPGVYSYTSEAFGYETVSGNVQVTDEDVEVDLTAEALAGKSVMFVISGLSDDVVPTITVKHEDVAFSAGENGSYSLVPGEYNYSIKADGYKTAKGTFTVENEDLEIPVDMVEGLEWEGDVADEFAGGSGTYDDPYQIANGDQLAYLSQQVNAGTAYADTYFVLTKDILMGGEVDFTPIGKNATYSFKGTFDGQGYTISGLKVSGAANQGLFGYTNGAVIRNLSVVGSVVGTGSYVGGIVGYLNGTIEDCANYASVQGNTNVGGIAGYLDNGSVICRCFNKGTITGGSSSYSYLGGIVGNCRQNSSVSECYNNGTVNVTGRAGGIAGLIYDASLAQCYNVGSVTGTGSSRAIVGYVTSGVPENCYYLSGTVAIDSASSEMHEVSEEEMASALTVAGLGGAFVLDELGQNEGYPVLSWQDPTALKSVMILTNYEDAQIYVIDSEGEEVAAEEDGSYKLSEGGYSYSVTREECNPVEGTFEIAGSGLLITVELQIRTYPLTLTLSPEDMAFELKDSEDTVVEETESGYMLSKGTYSWSASKFAYVAQTGELTITGEEDQLEVVLEDAERYTVTFNVTDKDTEEAVEAVLELRHATGGVQTAQEDGSYLIPAETYSYIATAEGYMTAKGTIEVTENDQFSIIMEQGSDVWTGEIAEIAPNKETIDGKEYYLITSGEELAWFRNEVASGSVSINGKLMTNIVLNEEDSTANGWAGIGDYSNKFVGTFDGNGKTISGYYSTGNGLFGYLGAGAEIKNTTLIGTINASGTIGGFANQSYGSFENCINRVDITNQSSPTGGIVGRQYAGGTISNCENTGDITVSVTSDYSNCYAGGIAGESYVGIDRSSNSGSITGTRGSVSVGGILGAPASGSTSEVAITNCYNEGNVSAGSRASSPYVGGISGRHTLGSPSVLNCYNAGLVSSDAASSKVGAIVGDMYNGNVSNSYYLEGTASAACGYDRDDVIIEATEKTSDEMLNRDFVLALNNQAFGKSENGYPILLWQGGTYVDDSEDAQEVAAAKEALEFTDTLITESRRVELPTVDDFSGTITWSSSNTDIITDTGMATLPESGTENVTLTATITKGRVSVQKSFVITVKSVDAQQAEALADAKAWLENGGALNPYDDFENINDYISYLLGERVYADPSKALESDIIVSVSEIGNRTYPVFDADGTIAEDGTITWFYADPSELQYATTQAIISDVKFTLTLGEKSVEVTKNVNLGWDKERLMPYLEAAAQSALSVFDDYQDNDGNIAIPAGTETVDLPVTQEGYRFTKVNWTSNSEKMILGEESPLSNSIPLNIVTPEEDRNVTLTIKVSFLLSDDNDPIYFRSEDAVSMKLLSENLDALRAVMQQQLDEHYTLDKLVYSVTKEPVAPQSVIGDIQLPTPRNTGVEDYNDYKFVASTSNEDVAKVNGYRVNVFRPMPDEEAEDVTLTVTMSHKTKDVSVTKDFELTVLPLTESELQDAVSLMNQVKDAYWDGINDDANESPLKITASLHAFQEAHLDADGNLVWVYNINDRTDNGIVVGDQRDYSTVEGQEEYNKFKSSNKAVIAHENLILTQPQYHTAVEISSVLEHSIYAKYAKTVTEGRWYDEYFSKLYNVPVSVQLTVIGTDGEDPNGDTPPTEVTVRVRMNGLNHVGAVDKTIKTRSDKTVAEAITEALGSDYDFLVSYGYIGSLTGPVDFNKANENVAYWGQYYRYGDEFDTVSDLNVKVTDGAVYGIMPYVYTTVEPNFYNYSLAVWFDETSYTANAGESVKLQLYEMSNSMAGGALGMPGIPVSLNGSVIATTDNNGQIEVTFNHAGTYTLEVLAENYSYTYADVVVEGDVPDPTPTPIPEPTETPTPIPTPEPESAEAPVLISAASDQGGVLVKWNASEGAASYRVYRKTSTGSWGRIVDTVNTSYVDTTAVSGTAYTYTVRCLGSDGKTLISSYDKTGKTVTYIEMPVITKAECINGGIKLTWNVSAGATRYRVYRKNADGTWGRLGDTTAQSYTDTTAIAGQTYTYTVRCLSSDGKQFTSAYDKTGKTVQYIATPVLVSATSVASGVKVTWNASVGAEKYRVFRKVPGGTWTKLADVTSLSYVDATAVGGTTYIYTVRCVSSDGTSYTSYHETGKTIKYIAVPTISQIANTSEGLKIAWTASVGAEKYRVYRKNADGTWGKIGDTTSSSYTDTNVVNGTAYVYTVRCLSADGKSFVSAYDTTGTTGCRLVAPTISTVINSAAGSLKVTWNQNAKATGYQVYYKTGSTAKTETVTGYTTLSKVISSLSKGSTYDVYVRSYKNLDSKNYYSAWSAKKTITISK